MNIFLDVPWEHRLAVLDHSAARNRNMSPTQISKELAVDHKTAYGSELTVPQGQLQQT